jgi:hypothetical protein
MFKKILLKKYRRKNFVCSCDFGLKMSCRFYGGFYFSFLKFKNMSIRKLFARKAGGTVLGNAIRGVIPAVGWIDGLGQQLDLWN